MIYLNEEGIFGHLIYIDSNYILQQLKINFTTSRAAFFNCVICPIPIHPAIHALPIFFFQSTVVFLNGPHGPVAQPRVAQPLKHVPELAAIPLQLTVVTRVWEALTK